MHVGTCKKVSLAGNEQTIDKIIVRDGKFKSNICLLVGGYIFNKKYSPKQYQ